LTDVPGDHDRIGPTAHYTAYVWRRLGLPHAELFATRTGAVLYWGFFALGEWTTRVLPGVPSMCEYLEYRHRLIDAVVDAEAPDVLVELGAGLTRRAVTWVVDRGARGVELDLPAMAAIKREAIARAPASLRGALADRHAVHDADVLADDFAPVLAAAIGDAVRPVVVAEGLLSYFDPPDRARLLDAVAAALHEVGGGVFVCDLHTATAQAEVGRAAHALRGAIRVLTRRRRALDPYADAEALFAEFAQAGFATSAIVDARAHVPAQPRLSAVDSPAHVVLARV
jgi:O-methyltransferase involved in polyketide biosynthesis